MRIPKPESLRLSRADFSILLATPATSLVPNVSAFDFPLYLRGGGSAVWPTTYSPYQLCPGLCSGEDTPAPPHIKTVNAGKLRQSIQRLQKRGHEEFIG